MMMRCTNISSQRSIKTCQINDLPAEHPATSLQSLWDRLSTMDGKLIVLDGTKVLVPRKARRGLLQDGHKSHCGAEKMKTLFRQLYHWPGMAT